jgi:subtilisin family serine protease
MAAPHAAGVAAMVLAAHPGYTPAQVRTQLLVDAAAGRVTNPGPGSPNLLLEVHTAGPTSRAVTLRAQINNRYVTAESAGAASLIANRAAAGSWERFTLLTNADGSVSLRAGVNGRYVTAENAGASPLIANRTAVGAWEKFTLVINADGSVSLRAGVNGRYVTAENAGASPLVANRRAIGAWEHFDLLA